MSIYDKASLVLIPSGTKTSKVYSQKPVSGDGDFTFSRSTAATRVNADGNIEKETQNLLLQSNTFNTTWTTSNSSVTSGQSGYDGSNDAWELDVTTAAGHLQQSFTSVSGVHTISLYAKEGTLDFLMIYARDAGGSNDAEFYFDLGNGVVGSTKGSAPIVLKITDVGGGWYRCEGTSSGGFDQYRIYGSNVDNSVAGTGNIYIQDAQLEQGLVARDYIETTTTALYGGITDNVPRLDYTDSSCPALLLEPQRTNGITASEYFDGSNLNNTTISAEYNTADTLSPEGVYNATKLTATGSFPRYYDYPTIGDNVDVSLSVFAKQGDASVFTIRGNDKSNTAFVVNFDLANGTAELSQFDSLEPTFDIQPFGNGWYRCIVNTNSGSGATAFQIRPISHAQGETGGWTGSNYIYAYGVQYEASASYATSYIPCMGTSVTRNAETNELLDMQTNSVTTSGAWTAFFDLSNEPDGAHDDDNSSFFYTYSGNKISAIISARKYYGTYGEGNLRWYSNADSSTIGYRNSTNKKWVLICDGTSVKLYTDGALSYTYTATNSHNGLQSVQLLYGTSDRTTTAYSKFLIFPTAITNQEAIDLTT